MPFSTQKAEPRNKRFMLVRVTPARYVVDDLSLSGGVYTMTFNYPISSIERNGTALTETTSTPGSNDFWYHNETTNTLQIKLASAPSTTNVIVVYYHLFYTGSDAVFTYEDPENSATTVRTWEPRITDYPEITQSISNVVNGGVFSIEDISLTIANADNAFQSYLTLNDSFHDKDIRVWLCLDSVSNIQKGYVGKVKQISVDTDTVQISAYDSLSRLDQPCFMGDTQDEAYFTATGFPDVDPSRKDMPVRYIVGPWSRFTENRAYTSMAFDTNKEYQVFKEFLYEGTCVSFDADPATTTGNRTWGLCRTKAFRSTNYSTPSSLTGGGVGTFALALTYSAPNWALLDVALGDNITFTDGGSNTGYGSLNEIDASTNTLHFLCLALPTTFTIANIVISNNKAPFLVFEKASKRSPANTTTGLYYPTYGWNFTYNITTTSGGNEYMEVTFNSNLGDYLDPNNFKLYYRARCSVASSTVHGSLIQAMCEDVGLTVNSASITTANSTLNKTVYCSYPYFDEDDYKTYREYLQDILQSTLGILYLNNSFEVEYALLSAPSSSNAVTQSLVLRDSASVSVDYQDIVDQIIAYNPHNAGQAELVYTETASTTLSSTKARYLNGIRKATRFRHVLNDISTRLQDILDVRSTRYALYRFRTATEHLDAEIGDDLQFEHRILLGGDTAKDLKILSLSKGKDFTQIEATDLEDI